jgi:hypothetical protein
MSEHLTELEIERLCRDSLPAGNREAAAAHLTDCAACSDRLERERRLFASARSVASLFQAPAGGAGEPEHLPAERIVSYARGELGAIDRELVEAHLEECALCAAEARDTRQMLAAPVTAGGVAEPRRAPRWSWSLLGACGAAAVIALVVFTIRPPWDRADGREAALREVERMAAANAGLRGQVARLEQETARVRRENEALEAARRAAGRKPAPSGPAKTPQPSARTLLADSGGKVVRDASGGLMRVETRRLPAAVERLLNGRLQANPMIAGIAGRETRLMSGPATAPVFAVASPVATAVLSDRPTFAWKPLPGAEEYVVTLYDAAGTEIAKSERVAGTVWTPPAPLPRGKVYQWEALAFRGGEELDQAPKPPAPEARFVVLDAARAQAVGKAEREFAGSALALGSVYMEAGLLDLAEERFRELAKENPGSEVAEKLLARVRALRRPAR